MKKEFLGGTIGTILSATGTALQTQELLQTISIVITIIGAIISMIVIPILSWYKNANRDGKIDQEEIKEGFETLKEGAKEVKKTLDDKKKGDK